MGEGKTRKNVIVDDQTVKAGGSYHGGTGYTATFSRTAKIACPCCGCEIDMTVTSGTGGHGGQSAEFGENDQTE